MSADNYLYVRRTKEGWTFTHESASDDEPRPIRKSDPIFSTKEEAVTAAYEWEQEAIDDIGMGTEYGILFEEDLPELRAEKQANQEAMRDLVRDMARER